MERLQGCERSGPVFYGRSVDTPLTAPRATARIMPESPNGRLESRTRNYGATQQSHFGACRVWKWGCATVSSARCADVTGGSRDPGKQRLRLSDDRWPRSGGPDHQRQTGIRRGNVVSLSEDSALEPLSVEATRSRLAFATAGRSSTFPAPSLVSRPRCRPGLPGFPGAGSPAAGVSEEAAGFIMFPWLPNGPRMRPGDTLRVAEGTKGPTPAPRFCNPANPMLTSGSAPRYGRPPLSAKAPLTGIAASAATSVALTITGRRRSQRRGCGCDSRSRAVAADKALGHFNSAAKIALQTAGFSFAIRHLYPVNAG